MTNNQTGDHTGDNTGASGDEPDPTGALPGEPHQGSPHDAADHDGGRPEVLPCGRSRDPMLDQVAEGRGQDRDPHQRGCVHCQAALAEYDRLWAPLRELAAERVEAPEAGLEAALARIRGAIDDTDYATVPDSGGLTRIAARVVVVAARRSAQDVPGVRVALSKELTGDRDTDSEIIAGVAGASTAIEITIAADYGRPLHELAAQVRHAVTTRVRLLTDLEPVEVTVIVDDVLP